MPETAAIRVNYRFMDGYHVYTSEDVYGLYVASRDPQAAYAAVAPSLEKLIQLNEGVACRVEPTLTFSELIGSIRRPRARTIIFCAQRLHYLSCPLTCNAARRGAKSLGKRRGTGSPKVGSRLATTGVRPEDH